MFKKLKVKIEDRKVEKMLKQTKITSEGERLLTYCKDIMDDKADYKIQAFDEFIDDLVGETGQAKEVIVAALITMLEYTKENG